MTSNSNVLILIQYLSPGGIEWMVAHLANGLNANQLWKPHVLVYDHNDIEPIDNFFLENNISFFRTQKKSGFSFSLVFLVYKLVKEKNISVIHTHHLGALIVAAFVKLLRLGQVRIIYTQHSFIHLARYPRYRLFEKIFCYFADAITAVSEQVQEEFKKYNISAEKVQLVRNGSLFPKVPLLNKNETLKKRIQILVDNQSPKSHVLKLKFWVLYLGRIQSGKGQDQALKIWNLLTPQIRANTALIFMGPISDKGFFDLLKSKIEKASQNENIFVFPPTQKAQQWMQISDIFLSSSESEGGPLAPLEALGSGVPCVLSQIDGHQFYKKWSALYELSRPQLGAELIEKILLDSEANFEQLREETWKSTNDLRQTYSIDKMVNEFEKIYTLKK